MDVQKHHHQRQHSEQQLNELAQLLHTLEPRLLQRLPVQLRHQLPHPPASALMERLESLMKMEIVTVHRKCVKGTQRTTATITTTTTTKSYSGKLELV